MPGRRVLITGVGEPPRAACSPRGSSAIRSVEAVVGLDTRRPRVTLERTELIDADIRDPGIARHADRAAGAGHVVHNRIVRQPGPGMSARAMHDINVIGSLQLLAACEHVPSVRAIVIRGSAGIYGAEPHAPQFFGEEMTRLFPLRTRFQRDVAEIENYFETYSRRHPQVTCTMLRYQPGDRPVARHPDHPLPVRSPPARPTSASTRASSSSTRTTRSRRWWPRCARRCGAR